MKRVEIENQSYTFRFNTEFFPDPVLVGIERRHLTQAKVKCEVATVTADTDTLTDVLTPICRGDSYCSTKDEFNLHAGRKLALRRALHAGKFSLPHRKLFWEVFKQTLPKPKPSYATLKKELAAAKRMIDGPEEPDFVSLTQQLRELHLQHDLQDKLNIALKKQVEELKGKLGCEHNWQEQPGEPPVDICNQCGAVRR